MKYDLVILYSGGTDSRLMLKMALEQGKKPLLVNVRYGQDYTHHDHKIPTKCRMVSISGLLLDFDKTYADVAQDYIPNRNMMLISVAASIAEQEEIREIWLGANASDVMNYYPDCTSVWIRAINRCLVGLPGGVLVVAPLQDMTQEQVIKELDDNARK
jgi:7-cyano-7-deazaguanine synthase